MKYPPDDLLLNSRTQSLKRMLLLADEPPKSYFWRFAFLRRLFT